MIETDDTETPPMPVLDALARRAFPLYGFAEESELRLLNISENATYLITPPTGPKRVLRVHRPKYHSVEGIRAELAWIESLLASGIVKTAQPIPTMDGAMVGLLSIPELPVPRHCVLFEFVEGKEPDETDRAAAFALLGEITARLHRHSRDWTEASELPRFRWDFDAMHGERRLWGRWEDGLGMTPEREVLFNQGLEAIRAKLEAYGAHAERFGLVHADLRAANLILTPTQEICVIDFDDSGQSWFLYDLAAALSFIETAPDVPQLVASWVEGYQRVEKLSEEDLAMIPTFILLRRLLLVAWIGSHRTTAQAQAMGTAYTEDTDELVRRYLAKV